MYSLKKYSTKQLLLFIAIDDLTKVWHYTLKHKVQNQQHYNF